MATETSTKAALQQRAKHELKELAIISAYLYITLGAVIIMKTAVLRRFRQLSQRFANQIRRTGPFCHDANL